MKSIRRIVLVNVFGALALVLGLASAALADPALTIRDAWVRAAGDKKVGALFAVVENHTAARRAIVGVSADVAEKAELHEMKMVGELMKMSPVKQIDVPPGGSVSLKPGGYHVMLFGLKRALTPGDTVALTLTFDDGSTAKAAAAVRQDAVMKTDHSAVPKD